jgi:hypothetical protein
MVELAVGRVNEMLQPRGQFGGIAIRPGSIKQGMFSKTLCIQSRPCVLFSSGQIFLFETNSST